MNEAKLLRVRDALLAMLLSLALAVAALLLATALSKHDGQKAVLLAGNLNAFLGSFDLIGYEGRNSGILGGMWQHDLKH